MPSSLKPVGGARRGGRLYCGQVNKGLENKARRKYGSSSGYNDSYLVSGNNRHPIGVRYSDISSNHKARRNFYTTLFAVATAVSAIALIVITSGSVLGIIGAGATVLGGYFYIKRRFDDWSKNGFKWYIDIPALLGLSIAPISSHLYIAGAAANTSFWTNIYNMLGSVSNQTMASLWTSATVLGTVAFTEIFSKINREEKEMALEDIDDLKREILKNGGNIPNINPTSSPRKQREQLLKQLRTIELEKEEKELKEKLRKVPLKTNYTYLDYFNAQFAHLKLPLEKRVACLKNIKNSLQLEKDKNNRRDDKVSTSQHQLKTRTNPTPADERYYNNISQKTRHNYLNLCALDLAVTPRLNINELKKHQRENDARKILGLPSKEMSEIGRYIEAEVPSI